jgi:dTMP kinase
MLITFEGLDSSGKSTQAKHLVDSLRKRQGSPPVHLIREPGGTSISERIRDILLDRDHGALSIGAELFLFSASRAQLVAEVIGPAVKRKEFVVCDRYYDSTTAYQGYGRGIDLRSIQHINRLATSGLVPDITLLLDLSLAALEQRRAKAGLDTDRMESAGKEFYERVRAGYLRMARDEPERFVIIDASGGEDTVKRSVWEQIERRLP